MSKVVSAIRQIAIVVSSVVFIVGTYITQGQLLSVVGSWLKQTTGQFFDPHLPPQGPASAGSDSNSVEGSAARPVTVFAAGDIAKCKINPVLGFFGENLLFSLGVDVALPASGDSQHKTAELIDKHPEAVVFGLGDFVYPNGSPARYNLCYDNAWGSFKSRTYPVPGNHDYGVNGAYAYFDYWGKQAGPGRKGYYSFNLNEWLILALNSEISAEPSSAQDVWLRNELESSNAACVLAFFHRPAYSSHHRSRSDNARHLFRVLHTHGASVVLNGHNHFYERTMPLDGAGNIDTDTGIISFVSGAIAQSYDYGQTTKPFTEKLIVDANGILKIELGQTGLSWRFLAASTGEVLDEGHAQCNPKRAAR